jgi:hypothetical protein
MVSVVTVDRSAAADAFHNLKCVDIGPDADEPVPDGPEVVDYLFDADKLTFLVGNTTGNLLHHGAEPRENGDGRTVRRRLLHGGPAAPRARCMLARC